MGRKILISAGEASGDLYAAALVETLRLRRPDIDFFGCAGQRMRASGVRGVVDASRLSVVGLVEVLAHIPRIYGEYRRLLRAAESERPDLAILTDSPDFHLRVAPHLSRLNIPVVYLIAPQAWAWRSGRTRLLRRHVALLLCIFPFEEDFFRSRGVPAVYIGHPLAQRIRPSLARDPFLRKHGLNGDRPLVAVLPGSRPGEVARHLPALCGAVRQIEAKYPASFVLGAPLGFSSAAGCSFFRERLGSSTIQVIEGDTWNLIAHADLALAASGTVTMEAALLGTPMVTFYRVAALSWVLGRMLVNVPYYSMVNLIAGSRVAPELIQGRMNADRLAAEALLLLEDPAARRRMRDELAAVKARLSTGVDAMEKAAEAVLDQLGRN